MTTTTLTKATRNFQRAAACGDIDAAIRWMEILLAHMRAIRSRARPTPKSASRLTPRSRRLKPKPAPQAKAPPTMPVMLDPNGFSPGGTPNWFLNLQRLERAGLPASMAPPTQATLRRQQSPTNT